MSWRQKYNELKEYVAAHPAIQISDTVMIMPDDDRPGFYKLFNAVCTDFIEESFRGMLEEAAILGTRFAEARQQITTSLRLKNIEIGPNYKWFLLDPVDGLTRKLFDPLFDLLKNKMDLAEFEGKCANLIDKSFKAGFAKGYEYWVMLSLMQLMEPDAAYVVPVADQFIDPGLNDAETRPGWFTEDVPDIISAETIPLDISQYTPFLVPKVILHSGALQAFASICTDFHEVYRKARALSKNVEWYKVENVHKEYGGRIAWPDLAIYLGETSEELKAISDYTYIARPDIVVNIMETKSWFEDGKMEMVKLHHHVLNPRLGSFVICREPFVPPVPENAVPVPAATPDVLIPTGSVQSSAEAGVASATAAAPLPDDIQILNVGYEADKLEPIIDAVVKSRQKPECPQ